MTGEKCGNIPAPNNLNHCLQLLGKISQLNTLKSSVLKEIKSEVVWYCNEGSQYLIGFENQYIGTTFDKVHGLLAKILQQVKYGHYGNLQNNDHAGHNECITTIVHIITTMLPKVYSALYYLYFQVESSLQNTLHGGTWSSDRVSNNNLHKWIVDQAGTESGLLIRGFGDGLSSNQASELANILSHLVSHDEAKALQNALVGMLFICPWDPSLTGHACLFIHYFCGKVKEDNDNRTEKFEVRFNELNLPGTFINFKTACDTLKSHLEPLVGGDNTMIQAVCQKKNTDLYTTLWDDKFEAYFTNYVIWFKDQLPSMIASLDSMLEDFTKWDTNTIKAATSAGPFKYGFVFTSKWQGRYTKEPLHGFIKSLTKSLTCLYVSIFQPKNLKHCLQLFGRLKALDQLKVKVKESLKTKLDNYCGKNYLKNPPNTSLDDTFDKADQLLQKILERGNYYGPYTNLQMSEHSACNCVTSIVQTITTLLPMVFATLYFLYFNTTGKVSSITGSGQWKSDRVNGSGHQLAKFLTDDNSMNGLKLMHRGFVSSELKKYTKGSNLANSLEDLVQHDKIEALQNALVGMLFICPWSDALTGHAMLFLHKFCEQVSRGSVPTFQTKFTNVIQGGDFKELKTQCNNLKPNLEAFITESADNVLYAVCQKNNSLYSNVWDDGTMEPEQFEEYLRWLQIHLPNIITALQSMSEACTTWTALYLKYSLSPGPFRYGFVFSKSWNGQSQSIQSKLSSVIIKLVSSDSGSLPKLMEELQPKAASQSQPNTLTPILTGLGGTLVGAGAGYYLPGLLSSLLSLL